MQVSVTISTMRYNLELVCTHREEPGGGDELIPASFRVGGSPLWRMGPESMTGGNPLWRMGPGSTDASSEKEVSTGQEGDYLFSTESCW